MNFADLSAKRDREPTAAEFAYGDRDAGETCLATLPSVEFFLGARIDSDWIKLKTRTEFDGEVMRNLKRAVYTIGQGGRRWFSGGGELSQRQASAILDYAVLIELLLEILATIQRSFQFGLARGGDDFLFCAHVTCIDLFCTRGFQLRQDAAHFFLMLGGGDLGNVKLSPQLVRFSQSQRDVGSKDGCLRAPEFVPPLSLIQGISLVCERRVSFSNGLPQVSYLRIARCVCALRLSELHA